MSDPNDPKTEEISSPSMTGRKKPPVADEGTLAFVPPKPGTPIAGANQPATRHDSEMTQAHDGKRPPSSLGDTIGISPESPVLNEGSSGNTPKQIANYEILDVLGRGGMGVVYKARQKGLNRMAALKMILAGGHAGTEDLIRFQTEAEAVAKLTHPNIVQIFEVGDADGHPFFSLEFVDGGTLAGKLTNNPLPARQAAEMIEPLARAVGYAHDNGILHRDLKPGNILLTLQGTPKITDFGLAKRMGDDSSNTGTGSILGTPAYMAPEQAEGKIRELGPGVDIYALGSVLYHTLTGRPPFMGETVLDTLQQVKNDDPVPPSRLQPKVPQDLETICMKCLQKEPRKRYETAKDLADDLHAFLNNEPIKARPIGLIERAVKWAGARPQIASMIAAIVVILTGTFLGMATLWLRAEALRKTAEANEILARDNEQKAKDSEIVANTNLEKASRTLYAAQMNLAQDALKEAKVTRLSDLLDAQAKGNLKGFEWDYLKGLLKSDLLPLKGHTKSVQTVAFRPPSGKQLASGSGDGSIVLWDPDAADKKFRRLKSHAGVVRQLAFSKNGQWLASAGEDGEIRVFDLAGDSADPVKTIAGNRFAVGSLAFSPGADWLVAGSDDGSVRIWNLDQADAKPKALAGHDYPVTDVAVSGDGGRIASASLDKTVKVWDAWSHELIFSCPHGHWVSAVGFSADGKRLASASWDLALKIWNARTGAAEFDLQGLPGPARNLAFSPDGSRLAASCQDNSVVVWDLVTKKIVREWKGEPEKVRTVAFSTDGQLLASVNFDLGRQEGRVFESPAAPLAVAFGAGDALAAAAGDGKLYLWNADAPADSASAKAKPASEIQTHKGAARALAFNPVRKLWATAGEDGEVVLIEPPLGDKKSLSGHKRWVLSLAFDPAGDTLASGSADGQIFLWNMSDPQTPRLIIDAHKGPVRGLSYRSNGQRFASAGVDRAVHIWDATTGHRIASLPHEYPVLAVAFQPKTDLIATASADRVIRLWNSTTGEKIRDLTGHTHAVTCLAFTPDGIRLVSGSDDSTIKIWDPATGQETLSLRGHTLGVTGVAFSPNPARPRLASSSWDGEVRLWETPE